MRRPNKILELLKASFNPSLLQLTIRFKVSKSYFISDMKAQVLLKVPYIKIKTVRRSKRYYHIKYRTSD
jgi:hypothetical protein